MHSTHKLNIKTKKQIHARTCRLKAGSNQRSKAKEELRMLYTRSSNQR